MELIYLIIGIVIGAIIGFLIAKLLINKTSDELPKFAIDAIAQKDNELTNHANQIAELKRTELALSIAKGELAKEKDILKESLQKIEIEAVELRKQINVEREKSSALNEKQENLAAALSNQKKELLEIQDKFTKEFENIANKVLDEKSKKFTEKNHEKLGEILQPFQERIKDFKEEIAKTAYQNMSERKELLGEIKHLSELNKTMQAETKSLTLALKQDSKAQGNWGEVILERVLENSGLTKNREYFTQQTYKMKDSDDALRPDVVVKLPDNKNVIIDAKVSLTAYNELINAQDDDARNIAMKAHLLSIKNHINGLAGKNYQFAEGLDTPDFVLLFMPIESSFSIATQADNDIFNYAWSKKIVIVSPSTLLATLRTISSLWKHEYQNKNAMKIAEQAGKMYDKFVGFAEDLTSIGTHLQRSEKAYQSALNKFSAGNGNLVGMAQKVIDLGVKSKKQIPKNFIDKEEQTTLPLSNTET